MGSNQVKNGPSRLKKVMRILRGAGADKNPGVKIQNTKSWIAKPVGELGEN